MPKLIVDSCAFLSCDQVSECAFGPGQCVQKRFPQHRKQPSAVSNEAMPDNARALAGTKPGRASPKKRR